jgi:hypothetical protein
MGRKKSTCRHSTLVAFSWLVDVAYQYLGFRHTKERGWAGMNIYPLIEDLRQQGYFLEIYSRYSRTEPTTYAARFWQGRGHYEAPLAGADTFAEAVRLAAITIIKRDDLNVGVPRREPKVLEWIGFIPFIFWVSVGLVGAKIIKTLIMELS